MFELVYIPVLVIHIIFVMVAVGSVTVTDYLHLLGLRDPKLEKRSLFIFPHISNLIRVALFAIYITGTIMVIANPSVFSNELFWVKLSLVILVTINGFILHHKIWPEVEKGIKVGKYPPSLIKVAALTGSLSVVSWYSIVVLSITKTSGYSAQTFVIGYLVALVLAVVIATKIEQRRKHQ